MKKRFNINLDDSAFTKERTPPKHHFQPSSNVGQSSTSGSSAKADKHLSYAQYIIKGKGHGFSEGVGVLTSAKPRQKEPDLVPSAEGRDETSENNSGGDEVKKSEEEENHKEGNLGTSLGPKPAGSGSSIIVSPRQRGNPILKFVRSVPWEFGEVVPDYVLGQTTCALFLSLRYHNLNPNYIHDRLKQLGHSFTLRVLLVQVDVKDPHHALKELARICIMADCTLILAWSPEEAGRYLETYKSYEKKPADLLKEQVEKDYLSKVTDCLTTVKSINKTDAITLLSTFSSLEGIISASKEDLLLCPGLGPQKARRLYDVLHKPFLKSKTKCDS
ncbi:DNA excision repair protein ERCC-1 [Dunckerocampus dactyliophorus]|uniref:DNA excision repair protein ERCC-1 n=1 Tax=Dunckerocampus dactyliophorus TaxID=161453 RepID=UPI002406A2EB|nr:DNA excision repair protein ERCC-1 [Dunckerocampus dactyliophorus]